jgi:hypothetical protein
MTKTLASTYNSRVTLSGAADNPATITSAGLLNAGLYGSTLGVPWAITNIGNVLGSGITLEGAGAVVNTGNIIGSQTFSSYGALLPFVGAAHSSVRAAVSSTTAAA